MNLWLPLKIIILKNIISLFKKVNFFPTVRLYVYQSVGPSIYPLVRTSICIFVRFEVYLYIFFYNFFRKYKQNVQIPPLCLPNSSEDLWMRTKLNCTSLNYYVYTKHWKYWVAFGHVTCQKYTLLYILLLYLKTFFHFY